MKNILFLLLLTLAGCQNNEPTPYNEATHSPGRLAATSLPGTTWQVNYPSRMPKVIRFDDSRVYVGFVIKSKDIYFPRNDYPYTVDGDSVYVGADKGRVYEDSLVINSETFIRRK